MQDVTKADTLFVASLAVWTGFMKNVIPKQVCIPLKIGNRPLVKLQRSD